MKRCMVAILFSISSLTFCMKEENGILAMLTFSDEALSSFFEKNSDTNKKQLEKLAQTIFQGAIPIDHGPDIQSYIFYWDPEERTTVGFLNAVVNRSPISVSRESASKLTITFPASEVYDKSRDRIVEILLKNNNFRFDTANTANGYSISITKN